jgi:hypothetical protein
VRGDPNRKTLGTAIVATGTWCDSNPMSPTDITIVHAKAIHAVRVKGRR